MWTNIAVSKKTTPLTRYDRILQLFSGLFGPGMPSVGPCSASLGSKVVIHVEK